MAVTVTIEHLADNKRDHALSSVCYTNLQVALSCLKENAGNWIEIKIKVGDLAPRFIGDKWVEAPQLVGWCDDVHGGSV